MNELTINLDSRSKKPLYEQIYDYIKSDIQNGRLRYGMGRSFLLRERCPDIWKSAAARLNWHMNNYYQKDILNLPHTAVFSWLRLMNYIN